MFDNVFVQAFLSLLASFKPIFSVKKHFGSKPLRVPMALNHYYTSLERTINDSILLHYIQ